MESDDESEELVYYQLIFGFLTCVQAFLYWRMFCVARSGDDETQLTAATACSSFMDVASLGRVILFLGCHKYSFALWSFADAFHGPLPPRERRTVAGVIESSLLPTNCRGQPSIVPLLPTRSCCSEGA